MSGEFGIGGLGECRQNDTGGQSASGCRRGPRNEGTAFLARNLGSGRAVVLSRLSLLRTSVTSMQMRFDVSTADLGRSQLPEFNLLHSGRAPLEQSLLSYL